MKNFNWLHFVLFAVTGLLFFCCFFPVNAAEGESKTYTFKDQYWNDDSNFYYTQCWRENMSTSERIAIYRMSYYTDNKGGLWCDYIVVSNSTFTVSFDSWYQRFKKDGTPFGDKVQSSGRFLLTVRDISAITAENASSLKSSTMNLETTIPMFSTLDSVRNYIETGDTTQQINKNNYEKLTDDKPLFDDFADLDFSDTDTNYLQDFRLEGFRSDYFVNAVWSSVHIPNKLQQWMDKGTIDMDDVAVMVMFTYANKNFPETDKYTKYYPRLLSATDLAATINVADFAPANDMYYLSGLSFIPVVEFTYYNSGMGTSMKPLNLMYYGSMNHIYFKQDGSANGAAFDAGDINGNKDGGFGLGNDDYNGIGGITGDITDALSKFSELLDSLYGSLSRVAKFATVVFSWLPWWASLLIGAAVAVCFILRIAGR